MTTFVAVYFATSLSILGSLFTISTYMTFPESRTTSQIFAVWLAIGSIGVSTPTFMRLREDNDHLVCVLSGLILSYFSLSTLFTTACVAHSMRSIFYAAKENIRPKFVIESWHWAFVWGLPLILIPLPLLTKSYGKNDEDKFCLIRTDFDNTRRKAIGEIWEAVILYIPVFVVIVFISYTYREISVSMKSWRDISASQGKVEIVIRRLSLYPIILILVYLLPFLHRLAEATADIHPRWLILASAASLRLQGFFDALAYGLNPNVMRLWKGLLLRCYCFRAPNGLLRNSRSPGSAGNCEGCITALSCCYPKSELSGRNVSTVDVVSSGMSAQSTHVVSNATTVDIGNKSHLPGHQIHSRKEANASVNALGWRCSVSDFDCESDILELQRASNRLSESNEHTIHEDGNWNDEL